MGDTAPNVFPIQALIKGDRGVQFVDQRVGVFPKTPGPKFHTFSP